MTDENEIEKFMLKFYESMIYGMLKSRFVTDDRLTDAYIKTSESEKKDLDSELIHQSKNIASQIVKELKTHNLLIEDEPTKSQAKEIEEIIRKILLENSGE